MRSHFALDLETACAVEGCKHFGQAMCAEGHSLSPWHSRITVIGVHSANGESRVFRSHGMLERFRAYLERSGSFTAHSGKFDVLHLAQKGIPLQLLLDRWISDTHLLAFVWTDKIPQAWLDDYAANKPKGQRAASQHSLKTLAPYFLGTETYWEVDDKDDDEYVLKDVRYTMQLDRYLRANMPAEQQEFVDDKLLPWTKMLVEAEFRGLKLDVPGLLAYRSELEQQEQALKAQLDAMWASGHAAYHQIMLAETNRRYDSQKLTKNREDRRAVALARVPTHVSYDSPAQMKWLLSEHLGYDIRSLEGDDSTGKEVLIRLSEEGKEDVGLFLKWRKTQKILTAFIPKMLELKDSDDVIHPIYNPTGARTGRTSSERPNAQQVPSALKRFFKPRAGKLIGYDQAAIEPKLIGSYLEDPAIIEILESGDSIHNANTIAFFGLNCKPSDVPKLYPKQRKASKNCGLALFFGAGAKRIRIALTQGGFPVSQAEARRMHKNFLNKFAHSMEASGELVSALERGEVIPNLLGRPIKIQNPQDCYMTGLNTMVQSSASDINLDRMHAAVHSLRSRGIECYPVLTVHDYCGIEVIGGDQTVQLADTIVRHELTSLTIHPTINSIKLEVEGGISNEWN